MDDLISRQAAIDVIDKIFPVDPMRNEYTQGITCGAALAKEWIKSMPSAEPKRGKWIIDTNDIELINCSCCRRSEWSECFEDIVKSFNYCPNCGAKMEVEEK